MAGAYEPLTVESSLSRFYLYKLETDFVFLFGEKKSRKQILNEGLYFFSFGWEKEIIANKYHIKAMYT